MADTIQAINYIVKTPGTLGGDPRIAGHRIGVHDIVIVHLQLGEPISEIAENYNLSLAEIYAALSYYYDHRQEIDNIIAAMDRIEAAYQDDEATTSRRAQIEARAEARRQQDQQQ
jgi:uncharacterized protein (DUF433 family)